MRIDFVSDVVCPWCAIGLVALEQALARIGGDIVLHFQPFELNRDMPPEGEDIVEHLTRKYGLTPDAVARNADAIRTRGASLGFVFGARHRTYNTFDAHRLLTWADREGLQRPLKHALLRAYFTDGQDPSDPGTLVRVAAAVGLDADAAREVLGTDAFAAEVRTRERFYADRGIHAVPSVIVDDRHLIQGGQPVEVYERTLRSLS